MSYQQSNIIEELWTELIILENIPIPLSFFDFLVENIRWDESIRSRKTASFGIPYDYSGISYNFQPIPDYFNFLTQFVFKTSGFFPNNCLVNYYTSGNSKMGFHSDNIEILSNGTGIAVFSFGNTRVFKFRNKINKEIQAEINLKNNSYLYMSQRVQSNWLHAVLPTCFSNTGERISVTFRKLVNSSNTELSQ